MIEPRKANKEFDIISPLERHKDSQQANSRSKTASEKNVISDSVNYNKEGASIDSTDSVNHFYTQECANDDKLTQKQSVSSYDIEQVPLTIYNDISQKLIEKQQNGSNSPKVDNRYDKKLIQFNLKPSVSNVFSSLNEYINAPPGSSDCIQSALEEEELQSDVEHKTLLYENEASQLIQSSVKDADKGILLKQATDAINGSTESSASGHPEVSVPITLNASVACKSSIEKDVITNVHATSSNRADNEKELLKNVSTIETGNELNATSETVNENPHTEYNLNCVHESTNIVSQESNSGDECTNAQSHYCENESVMQIKESDEELDTESFGSTDKHENNLSTAHKPLGFNNINDLSEDELTKYLTELEEEKLQEESNKLENVSTDELHEVTLADEMQSVLQDQEDGDKCKAEILQSVVRESSEIMEKELSDKVENISVIEHEKEKVDKGISKELEKHSQQQYDDEGTEDKYSDILDNTSRELKLLHTDKDDKINQEDIHLASENDCISNATSIDDIQEHGMNHLNGDEGLLSDKTETRLKEQEENPVEYNQVYELKMQSSIDNDSEENNLVTPEMRILNDTAKLDDTTSKSVEISARSSINETNDESEKPIRPQTLDIVLPNNINEHQTVGSTSDTPLGQLQLNADSSKEDQGSSPDVLDNSLPESNSVLGKLPPFWVPDSYASSCMLCDVKFTVLKRRHHCRACGKVLCNKCCSMKFKLEYQGNIDSRVCVSCYQLLIKGNL